MGVRKAIYYGDLLGNDPLRSNATLKARAIDKRHYRENDAREILKTSGIPRVLPGNGPFQPKKAFLAYRQNAVRLMGVENIPLVDKYRRPGPTFFAIAFPKHQTREENKKHETASAPRTRRFGRLLLRLRPEWVKGA